MPLTVLLGGAASGKSRAAVTMAAGAGRPVTLIATAEALDDEMMVRIERHRAGRPSGWMVVEEPLDLLGAIEELPAGDVAIVDCLTLWVTNMMGAGSGDDEVIARAQAAVKAACARTAPTLVVTNEVGSGIVPMHPVTRRYRDLLGRVNAMFAGSADDVLLLVAGRALRLDDPAALLTEPGGGAT